MKLICSSVALLLATFLAFADGKGLPDNFHFKKLDNGLEVLVIQDPSVPLATIELCVRNGAYTESPEFDGLSHLYEHMFFKANETYPSQEAFMNRISEMGATFNGTTSVARVNYYITLGSHNVVDGLEFMNAAIRGPLFLKEEMEKENIVVDAEFERNESNPFFFLNDEMDRNLWGDLYSRKNTIGDHHIIKTATPEKMKAIQAKYYHPNNTLLAIAGDVDPEQMFAEVERVYGSWEHSGFSPHEKYPIPEFTPLTKSTNFVVENENSRVPIIMRSWHGPDTRKDAKGTLCADLFSKIIAAKTSQFQQDLVDSGLALQVSEYYYTNLYTGPISAILVPNPAKVAEALAKFEEHIAMWDDEGYITEEQLQTAKDLIVIDEAYSSEKTSEYIHTVTFWWGTADIDYYTNYVSEIQKLTLQDLRDYVKKYITDKPNCTGVLVTPQMRTDLNIDEIFNIK